VILLDPRAFNIEYWRAHYREKFAEVMRDQPDQALDVLAIWQRFDGRLSALHNNVSDTDALIRDGKAAFFSAMLELNAIDPDATTCI
jgi:hypothetical protein